MARALSTAMLAAIQAGTVRPVYIFECEVQDGFVRAWTGVGNLTFQGNTFTGLGNLVSVAPVQEASDLTATGMVFSLSGIPSAYLATVLDNLRYNKRATLWLGCAAFQTQENLFLWSEEFDQAYYSKAVTLTPNDATAPDGTLTADKANDTSTGVRQDVSRNFSVSNDTVVRCASIHVRKKSVADFPCIFMRYTTGGTNKETEVRLNTATGQTLVYTGSPNAFGAIDAGDYWRFYVALSNNGTGNTELQVQFIPQAAVSIGGADAGTVVGFQHYWGSQLNRGPTPFEYTKTTDAAVAYAPENTLLDEPAIVFQGLTDNAEITEGAESAQIKLLVENKLITLDIPRKRRYTSEDQKLIDPTDLGFDFVPAMQNFEMRWGTK